MGRPSSFVVFVLLTVCSQAAPFVDSPPTCQNPPWSSELIDCPTWPESCPPCCPDPTWPGEKGRCVNGSCECITAGYQSEHLVTFQVTVQNQTFYVNTSDALQIDEARQQIQFVPVNQRQHIIGSVAIGSVGNTGWDWHLRNWSFFGMASEACDGLPSVVERDAKEWIHTHKDASFCPWSSYISACISANCASLPPVKAPNAEFLITFFANSTEQDKAATASLVTTRGGEVNNQFMNGTIIDVTMPLPLASKVAEGEGVEAVEYQGPASAPLIN